MANAKTKKTKKDNKNALIGSICAIVVMVAIIIIAVVAVNNSGISDSYFVSDDSKYVLTMESDMVSTDEEMEYTPVRIHTVYEYSGDEITGMKSYVEYEDSEAANGSLEYWNGIVGQGYDEVYVNGKYVVAVANEEMYADLTVDQVKQLAELLESIRNGEIEAGEEVEVEENAGGGEVVVEEEATE